MASRKRKLPANCRLDSGNHHRPEDTIERLAELPGIGRWTANYIAMRALRWPDAFLPKRIFPYQTKGETSKQTKQKKYPRRPSRSFTLSFKYGILQPATGSLF